MNPGGAERFRGFGGQPPDHKLQVIIFGHDVQPIMKLNCIWSNNITFVAMEKFLKLTVILTGLLLSAVSCEMPSSGWGSVEGTVYETTSDMPLEGVLVRYADTLILTDKTGHYSLGSLPEGLQGITFTKSGFEQLISMVSVPGDGVLVNDVGLSVMKTGWAVGAVDTEFGTIFYTEDAGRNWKRQGDRSTIPGYDLYAVCAVNRKVCWAVGDSTFNVVRNRYEFNILKTSDAGNSWRRQGQTISNLNPVPINAVCAMDTSTAWAATAGNIILKGTSGGMKWDKCHQSEVTSAFQAISTPDTRHIWAGGIPSGAYLYLDYSEDGGETWSQIKMEGLTGSDIIYDISAVDSTSLYISGSFGVLHTSDNWRTQEYVLQPYGHVPGVSALGSFDAWAGTADGNIFYTHDGFAASEKADINTEAAHPLFNCISFIGDAVEGAATFLSPDGTAPGGLLYTDDSGHSWREPESIPYKVALYEVSFAGSRH